MTQLDHAWEQLADELRAGGAREDQLLALRECFYCGAHAVVWVMRTQPNDFPAMVQGLARHVAQAQEQVDAATH